MSLGTAQVSFQDRSGETTPNGLHVLRLVRRTPPVYATKCVKCGTETTAGHSRIEYATCQNSVCGRPLRKRSRDEEERERRVARERAALEEENRLAELRMAAQTEGYEKSSRYTPPPSEPENLTDRQRQAIRARREEERREEQERQRPVREAQARLQATHRQLLAAQRERLVNSEIEDVDVFISPEVAGIGMPQSHANEHNIIEFQKFHKQHTDFYPSEYNISLLHDYHVRNHAEIYTAEMLGKVFVRMRDAGVAFDEPPAPEPEPDVMKYDQREPVEMRIGAPVKPQPVLYDGWDDNGNPVQFTEHQVNRMSSGEMRRKLRIYKEQLTLRQLSPLARE